ncbi:MAG: nicotinate (nicotinamide) nucleotide adenylyltransferase [Acidobacteria bacterium]|nr:nicotinate (nicotinamide) nucleotide adenylyltransferase [Acidobacteriota bacterium]
MSTRRIGLLGGTFDPIHMGHLDLATVAQQALQLTQVLVIPANVPPHRPKPLTSSFHRFAMVALAVAGRSGWRASDVELRHETPSYTTLTLKRFHERGYHPNELFFLIGADAFADITMWRDYPGILDRAHFAVVSRPGSPVTDLISRVPALASRMVHVTPGLELPTRPSVLLIDGATADVSSTAVRARLAAREPMDGMLDPRVQQHIEQHGLYTPPVPDRRMPNPAGAPAAGRLHGQD